MLKAIYIIILLLASTMGLTAQNNLIVCGKIDTEWDIFTDIQPDTIIFPIAVGSGSYENYYIDMDGNQISDYKIESTIVNSGGGSENIIIASLQLDSKIAYFIKHDSVPDIFSPENPMPWIPVDYTVGQVFNFGDTIDDRRDFIEALNENDAVLISLNTGSPFYEIIDDWLNIGEKYIGISMQVNDVTLYGWILVEVTNYARVIVKEFACNKNPYIGISPNTAAKAFEIYPNPASNEVLIKLNGENAGKTATFTLYDLSGKKLLLVADIPQNGHIALPALAKGLYIAEIEVDGQREIRKLQIE
ncbi:MAG: T9SS type A sorting domain-containing protein [Bacteroidales bacterium]|nr:T9SS type A sorting domain-containing protein [Bacteroidales bacterium]